MAAATALAIAGLAATATTTTMSFVEANKQKDLQRQAEIDAQKAMADARSILGVNYFKQLSIAKLPYQLERDALSSVGAQQIQMAQESERGVGATAGRIQMAQTVGQRGIAAGMEQNLVDINNRIAIEDENIKNEMAKLSLGEVTGAQLKAREAQRMAAMQTTQGFQGVSSFAGQLANMAPLYPSSVESPAKTNYPVANAIPVTPVNQVIPQPNMLNQRPIDQLIPPQVPTSGYPTLNNQPLNPFSIYGNPFQY